MERLKQFCYHNRVTLLTSAFLVYTAALVVLYLRGLSCES